MARLLVVTEPSRLADFGVKSVSGKRRSFAIAVILIGLVLSLTSSGVSGSEAEKPRSMLQRFWNYVTGRTETAEFSTVEDPELSVFTSADRRKAYDKATNYALTHKHPDDWDATVFLPARSISQFLDATLRNTVIEFPNLRQLAFTITEVRFRSAYGSGDIEFVFRPSIGGKQINFEIMATGTLLYRGYRSSNNEGGFITLAVAIKSVRPSRGGNLVAVLGEGVGTALTLAFRDYLSVEVPVPPLLQFETG
jgi:hypothetical protein